MDLATDFRDYKAGAVSFGVTFGRDKRFAWPDKVVQLELWHVHLEDESVTGTWDFLTENFYQNSYTQDNYTSNTMLVYGRIWDGYKGPYMLHSILAPDGHAKMDDRDGMRALALEFESEAEAYRRLMPSSDWILVE